MTNFLQKKLFRRRLLFYMLVPMDPTLLYINRCVVSYRTNIFMANQTYFT